MFDRSKKASDEAPWDGPQWEYKVLAGPTEGRLNEHGAQGWEAYAVSSNAVYLKRPRVTAGTSAT